MQHEILLLYMSAACETSGFSLHLVDTPANEVTCYSLNSLNEPSYREEILQAGCITIVGGPHATACYRILQITRIMW